MTTIDRHSLSGTVRADVVPGPAQGCWTYADYAALPEDGHRYEIINGVLYMAAAPSVAHQVAVLEIAVHLRAAVQQAGHGRVFVSPIDVELGASPSVNTQPDIVVVLNANLNIITPGRITGAPDLVVEVLSPGTAGYDRREKQDAYVRAGVPEYWLADPFSRTVEVLRLAGGEYHRLGLFEGDQPVVSLVVPELIAPIDQLFG